MFRQGIKDVDFTICNTDTQALQASPIPEKLQLGNVLTRGLGAGCNPEQGRKAALESIERIKESLGGATEMVFITAGMGGGTGTGAAPVIAKVARELNLLTVGVVTLPFRDEGSEFLKRAVLGIKELEKHVDSLLIIDNQKLYKIFGELSIFDAFPKADAVLSTAVKGIAEIITRPGFINVDFADVRMVMQNSGMAIMGTGTGLGENRAIKAVEEAFSSPLLNDCDLTTAKSVLVNITSSKDNGLTMAELSQIMDYIREYTGGSANNFKRGVVCDPAIGEAISVTVVATGFDMHSLPQISSGSNDSSTIILGASPQEKSSEERVIPAIPRSGAETMNPAPFETKQVNTPATRIVSKPEPVQAMGRRGKPALILEAGDNITDLENQPAYIRRKIKIGQEQNSTEPEGNTSGQTGTFKLEELDGKQFLSSDNSYLHQTQD